MVNMCLVYDSIKYLIINTDYRMYLILIMQTTDCASYMYIYIYIYQATVRISDFFQYLYRYYS